MKYILGVLSGLLAIEAAGAISCFSAISSPFTDPTANVVDGCSRCTKTFTRTGVMDATTQQCDRSITPRACNDYVSVVYHYDGVIDQFECHCCTDRCNNDRFCTRKDTEVFRIRDAVSRLKGSLSPSTRFSCYDSDSTDLSVGQSCAVCQRNSRNGEDTFTCGRLGSDESLCSPSVRAEIYRGPVNSNYSIECKCCSDRCNNPGDFCQSIIPPSTNPQLLDPIVEPPATTAATTTAKPPPPIIYSGTEKLKYSLFSVTPVFFYLFIKE